MNKTYTIGQIQNFHDYLQFAVKNNILSEDFAESIMDRQAWDELDEYINGYDNNIPEEQGSEAIDFK